MLHLNEQFNCDEYDPKSVSCARANTSRPMLQGHAGCSIIAMQCHVCLAWHMRMRATSQNGGYSHVQLCQHSFQPGKQGSCLCTYVSPPARVYGSIIISTKHRLPHKKCKQALYTIIDALNHYSTTFPFSWVCHNQHDCAEVICQGSHWFSDSPSHEQPSSQGP